MLDKGYGYIRISSFQSKTGDSLEAALNKLNGDTKSGLKGLVLDLRNNPGGVLNAAVQVSDAFLKSGKIVYTEGRDADSRLEFNATPDDMLKGAPMVVLVNGGSASASEIVSGALQDHKRAIIMGEKTFGKGSVQTILPMSGNAALKLTTARYYTPSGRSIQAEGIVPDIKLEPLQLSKPEPDFARLKEADLTRHLVNENGQNQKINSEKAEDARIAKLAKEDYQLYEALNILKGINISEKSK